MDMASAAAALYPSHGPVPAAATPPVASTPAPAPAQPAAPPVASTPSQAPAAATPSPAPAATQPSGPDATALYGDVIPDTAHVRWGEPVASPSDIKLPALDGIDDPSIVAQALSAAGAGQSTAAELYNYAAAAVRPGYVAPNAAATEATLRAAWGGSYARNLAAVQAAVATAAAKDPSLPAFLDRTGLGNDVGLIRRIAARVARR